MCVLSFRIYNPSGLSINTKININSTKGIISTNGNVRAFKAVLVKSNWATNCAPQGFITNEFPKLVDPFEYLKQSQMQGLSVSYINPILDTRVCVHLLLLPPLICHAQANAPRELWSKNNILKKQN